MKRLFTIWHRLQINGHLKEHNKALSEQEFKIFPLINVQQLLGLIAITVIL